MLSTYYMLEDQPLDYLDRKGNVLEKWWGVIHRNIARSFTGANGKVV